MEKLLSIADYVVYPSLIYMALYLFMVVMWLFATDFYDNFARSFDESEGFFATFFVLSIVNYFIGKVLWEWANPINYIFNGIILFVMLLVGIFFLTGMLTAFHEYCKEKRGKS